jgi:hypothetical protein
MNKSIAQIYEVGQAAIDADFAKRIMQEPEPKMADYLVVQLLEDLGFSRTVDAWREVDKATRSGG